MKQLFRETIGSLLLAAGVLAASAAGAPQTREIPGTAPQAAQCRITPRPLTGEVAQAAQPGDIPRRKVPGFSAPFAQARNSFSMPHRMKFAAPRAAAAPSGGTMRGMIITNSTWDLEDPQYGVYEYPITQGSPLCTPIHIDPEKCYILNGVYMGDTFWGAVPVYDSSFNVVKMTYYIFDTTTWEVLDEQPGDRSFTAFDMTWDATTSTVYAVYMNSSFKPTFGTFNTQYGFFEDIAVLPKYVSGLAANAAGEIYAITTSGDFWQIDKTDGTVTEIGSTGLNPYWASSAAIDPKTGLFYYALELESRAEMYEIDPATAIPVKLYDFNNNEQVFGMYIHHESAAAKAPSAPQNLALSFEGASLEGTVSFTIPAVYFDGTPAAGTVSYTVTVDGDTGVPGETTFGSQVSVPVSVPSAGNHTFSVVLSNADGDSPAVKTSQWVGSDVPAAVTGAKAVWADGTFTVTWNAVNAGVNGGFVNSDEVTYDVVRYPDGVTVAENTTSTSLTDEVAEPTDGVVAFYYSVTAVFNGQRSESVSTSKTSLGYIRPPYMNTLDSSAAITGFKVVDANGDGKKWGYNSAGGCLRIQYNSSKAMDDWVFTPAILLEAGKLYQFSFKASRYKTYTERVEAAIATDTKVAAVVATIIEPTDVTVAHPDGMTLTGSFIPETTGRYHFGIHGISEKDKYYLYADDISVSAGVELAGPAAVGSLTLTPDATGALEAEISFTAPALDLAGAPLESLDRIEIMRGETLVHTFPSPAVGAELSWRDTGAQAGNNTYTVTPFGPYGAGEPASATCFVGFDKPVATTQVYAVRGASAGIADIEWSPVTEDLAGNTLPDGAVTYNLYMTRGGETSLVAENLSQTSLSHRVCDDTADQEFVYFHVSAVTMAGEGASESSALVPVGAPYGLPFNESFANGRLSYIWGTLPLSATGSVLLGQDTSISGITSYDGDNGLMIFQGMSVGDRACIYSGVIHVDEVTDPALSLYYWNYDCRNTLSVQITDYTTGEADVLASVAMDPELPEGWRRLTADLSAYAGHDIDVLLLGTIVDASVIVVDNLAIGSMNRQDLKVRNIAMPGRVTPGVPFNVAVAVENAGSQPVDAYTVSLFLGSDCVGVQNCGAVEPGLVAVTIFDQEVDALAASSLEFHAEIGFDADQNMADNISQLCVVKVISPEVPAVTGLSGAETAGGVSLQWSAPDLTVVPSAAVTEDLSTLEPFSIGLSTTSVFDDYTGQWTMIDSDGLVPYTLTASGQPVKFPNSGKPIGFIVFNGDMLGLEGFEARSGSQMFMSFASGHGPNDDWLISPRLSGEAQTISFYARSLTTQYGNESFEFFTSSDLPVLGAFHKVDAVASVPGEWTAYTYTLPEGTRYFAIRCTSNDTFALCVDDLTFIPESPLAGLELKGYNVYRDGVKVNDTLVPATEFTDATAEPGNRLYTVTALYNRGESAMSDEISVALSSLGAVTASGLKVTSVPGAVVIEGAQGQTGSVVAPDGKVLFSGVLEAKTVVAVPPGICLVKVDASVVKLTVK